MRHRVRAQGPRELIFAQSVIEVSAEKFAKEMERCCLRTEMPFGDKIKIETGSIYRLKSRLSPSVSEQSRSARPVPLELAASAPSSSPGPSGSSSSPALPASEGTCVEPQS